MSSEENKAVVRRFIEKVFVQHDSSNIEELVSNESLKQIAPGTVQAFPDIEMTVEQLISEGDLVAVRLQPLENLYLLPRGAETDSPSELLDSERWPEICNELRRKFDFIVLDTPPAGLVADYELIQKACDGVIFVVRPDHTNRTLCYKALQIVPAEKLIGVVMNCAEEFFLQKTYGYSYYSYQQ